MIITWLWSGNVALFNNDTTPYNEPIIARIKTDIWGSLIVVVGNDERRGGLLIIIRV